MLRWVVVALLASLGCVSSPRAASELAQKSDPVTFSGVFEASNATLALQAKNQRTGAWVQFGAVRTRAADPLISSTGATFYRYEANVVLPQAADYWLPHPKSGRIEAQVRVVHGERVLRTFEADAESCARRGHARGLSEAALFDACAAREPQLSRVFVAACGGLGEPCCPARPASAACDAALSCQSNDVCLTPAYPVPILSDYRVDLSVPGGHRLRDAWLVRDDRTGGRDSERRLMRDHRLEPGVTLTMPHPNVARLSFDVGFFKPGKNRFKVRGVASRGEARRALDATWWELDYALPRTLGLRAPGHFELPAEHFPRRMSACRGPFCKDSDRDGLNDLWENIAVHQLRPRLRVDAGGDALASSRDLVRVLTSVTPLQRGGQEYVLFASVLALGQRGGRERSSDAEAFGMLYRIDESGGLRWVASAAKGQSCLTCPAGYALFPQDFDADGTPLLYVERDPSSIGPVAGLGAGLRERGVAPEAALGRIVDFFESNTF